MNIAIRNPFRSLANLVSGQHGEREASQPEFFYEEPSNDLKPINIEGFGEVYKVKGGFVLDNTQAEKLSVFEEVRGLPKSVQHPLNGGFVFIPTGARKAKT